MSLPWNFPPDLVEDALQNLLPAACESEEVGLWRLRCAMRHGLFSGGKRLRSQLVLEAAGLVGGADFRPEIALDAACALELIHAYSLIHDDLPSMDDADTRRGRPSVHREYGEAMAILAGDALLTLAFEVGASDKAEPKTALRALKLIAKAAGEIGMVGGQSLDIAWTRFDGETAISGVQLTQIHALKTGALIAVAAEVGAVLGGGSEEQIAALRTYGENLGRAFQLHDDVLDVEGDPEVTGKASSDAENDKMSAPAVFGLEKTKVLAEEAALNAVAALAAFGPEAQTLRDLARFVVERKK